MARISANVRGKDRFVRIKDIFTNRITNSFIRLIRTTEIKR